MAAVLPTYKQQVKDFGKLANIGPGTEAHERAKLELLPDIAETFLTGGMTVPVKITVPTIKRAISRGVSELEEVANQSGTKLSPEVYEAAQDLLAEATTYPQEFLDYVRKLYVGKKAQKTLSKLDAAGVADPVTPPVLGDKLTPFRKHDVGDVYINLADPYDTVHTFGHEMRHLLLYVGSRTGNKKFDKLAELATRLRHSQYLLSLIVKNPRAKQKLTELLYQNDPHEIFVRAVMDKDVELDRLASASPLDPKYVDQLTTVAARSISDSARFFEGMIELMTESGIISQASAKASKDLMKSYIRHLNAILAAD